MTIFSTAEEQQREPLEIGGNHFYPDFALSTAGGDVSVLAPWTSYVVHHRELISGQNPFSDEALETSFTGTQQRRSWIQRQRIIRETGDRLDVRSGRENRDLRPGAVRSDDRAVPALGSQSVVGSSSDSAAISHVRGTCGSLMSLNGGRKSGSRVPFFRFWQRRGSPLWW